MGIPPQLCFVIAVVFSFAMAIIITMRVEQPITGKLRSAWNRFRSPAESEPAVDISTATASEAMTA
jgi:peptidoglycan/LPS O-acetylase OafA/YrhL